MVLTLLAINVLGRLRLQLQVWWFTPRKLQTLNAEQRRLMHLKGADQPNGQKASPTKQAATPVTRSQSAAASPAAWYVVSMIQNFNLCRVCVCLSTLVIRPPCASTRRMMAAEMGSPLKASAAPAAADLSVSRVASQQGHSAQNASFLQHSFSTSFSTSLNASSMHDRSQLSQTSPLSPLCM